MALDSITAGRVSEISGTQTRLSTSKLYCAACRLGADFPFDAAREIGLDRQDGIATVVVAPIEVPLPDGGVKQGAAAGDRTR